MPLSRIVVKIYPLITEVALWFALLGGLIMGWKAGGFFGAIGTLITVTILAAVFFGAFLVINEIRDDLKVIKNRDPAA